MMANCRQRIATVAAAWLVLTSGCLTLDSSTKDMPTTGLPVQAAATWQTYVLFAADPAHEGASTPGLAGRLFLFGAQADFPVVAPGTVQVRLYADDPGSGPTDRPLEIWNIDAAMLKSKVQHDAIGWGYSLLLPWGTYRPDLTHIRLTVRFDPAAGGAALFAQETHLALHGQGPPVITATSSTSASAPVGNDGRFATTQALPANMPQSVDNRR
jgi:hypothetical protein